MHVAVMVLLDCNQAYSALNYTGSASIILKEPRVGMMVRSLKPVSLSIGSHSSCMGSCIACLTAMPAAGRTAAESTI